MQSCMPSETVSVVPVSVNTSDQSVHVNLVREGAGSTTELQDCSGTLLQLVGVRSGRPKQQVLSVAALRANA